MREPARHIQLPARHMMDSTYATVSETSDDMYAAIEDPSYIPTGTSQSNSDTYAVIDLPEENAATPADVSMHPGATASNRMMIEDHPYSKVDKRKKKANSSITAVVPPLPPGARPPSTSNRHSYSATSGSGVIPSNNSNNTSGGSVNDMYAKVHKRGSMPPPPPPLPVPHHSHHHHHHHLNLHQQHAFPGGQRSAAREPDHHHRHHHHHHHQDDDDPDLDMPMGASAMQEKLGARPKVKLPSPSPNNNNNNNSSLLNSTSPSVMNQSAVLSSSSSPMGNNNSSSAATISSISKQVKAEINYSDYEVALYDKGSKTGIPAHKLPDKQQQQQSYFEPGYEMLPDKKVAAGKRDSEPGYETVPGEDWKRYDGYETVPSAPLTNDYWRSNNSAAGYETVKEPSGGRLGLRDPGYEVVRGGEDNNGSWDRKRRDPGYESVGPKPKSRVDSSGGGGGVPRTKKEPPYAKIKDQEVASDGSEVGYETIPAEKQRPRTAATAPPPPTSTEDYDPGYEMLTNSRRKPTGNSEPGYETVVSKDDGERIPDYEAIPAHRNGSQSVAPSNNVSGAEVAVAPLDSHIHMSVALTPEPGGGGHQRRSSSVVMIERMEAVSDVESGVGENTSAEVNTHIFV